MQEIAALLLGFRMQPRDLHALFPVVGGASYHTAELPLLPGDLLFKSAVCLSEDDKAVPVLIGGKAAVRVHVQIGQGHVQADVPEDRGIACLEETAEMVGGCPLRLLILEQQGEHPLPVRLMADGAGLQRIPRGYLPVAAEPDSTRHFRQREEVFFQTEVAIYIVCRIAVAAQSLLFETGIPFLSGEEIIVSALMPQLYVGEGQGIKVFQPGTLVEVFIVRGSNGEMYPHLVIQKVSVRLHAVPHPPAPADVLQHGMLLSLVGIPDETEGHVRHFVRSALRAAGGSGFLLIL